MSIAERRPPLAPKIHIRGFDGLRAFAVTLVWLQHRTGFGKIGIGVYGVWLFFVLSGFLIIGILARQRGEIEAGRLTKRAALASFWLRRTYRIFPIYYLSLIVVLPILYLLHRPGMDLRAVVMNFFYLSNIWIGQIVGDWPHDVGHLWSLSIEEQFYIVMPVVMFSVPSRHLAKACTAILLFALAWKLGLHLAGAAPIAVTTSSFVNFGMLAYGGACVLHLGGAAPAGGTNSRGALLILAAYLAIPFILWRAGAPIEDHVVGQFSFLLMGLLLVSIYRNQDSTIVRVLEFAPIRYFGSISYGFYLYHGFVTLDNVKKILHAATGIDLVVPHPLPTLLNFLIPFTAAALSWHVIEAPILRLRRSAATRRSSGQSQALSPEFSP